MRQRQVRTAVTVAATAVVAAALLVALPLVGANAATSTYEAEAGTRSGGAQVQSASAASGGQVVGALNNQSANVAINSVAGGGGGSATVTVRYSNGYPDTRSLSLYVNGADVAQVSFPPTGGWNSFSTVTATVNLNSGTGNTIAFQRDSNDVAAADIDNITVTTAGSPTPTTPPPGGSTVTYEAESGTRSGGAQVQGASGASGGQVVGALNNVGARVSIGSVGGGGGGSATVTVRYSNGYPDTRSLSLYVNGSDVAQVSFPATGGWNSFSTVTATVNLNAGTGNTIAFQRDSNDVAAADIDNITVTTGGSPPPTTTPPPPPSPGGRVRTLVMTDGEIDDKGSFHRLLSYTNDLDVRGVYSTSSRYQGGGNGTDWIRAAIDVYGTVRANLVLHDSRYPTSQSLRNEVKQCTTKAGMAGVGANEDTEGSNHMVGVLRGSDTSVIYIMAWGGTNCLAQALFRIRESYPGDLNAVLGKIRLVSIEDQDAGTSSLDWMLSQFPALYVVENDFQFLYMAYGGQRQVPANLTYLFENSWLTTNVKNAGGALGADYPMNDVNEGDTPSFLYLIPTGLRSLEDPSYGGWGGRFFRDGSRDYFRAASDADGNGENTFQKPGWRWLQDVFNDWAARSSWAAKPYAQANHRPNAVVAGGLNRTVTRGQTANLDATGSSDPDGNTLSYRWWQYTDADTCSATVSFSNATSANASFVAPNEPGKTVHVILEVTDNGSPALKHYQRIIFQVQ